RLELARVAAAIECSLEEAPRLLYLACGERQSALGVQRLGGQQVVLEIACDRVALIAQLTGAFGFVAVIQHHRQPALRLREDRAPTISLAYLPPPAGGTALFSERPLPLDPATLTRLSPAVERPGIHLGVWPNGNELRVWGATRSIPPLCFVVEVIEPGLLVIKHRRADPDGKFANVAVLEGDQVKIVDAEGTITSECPDLVMTLLGFDQASADSD